MDETIKILVVKSDENDRRLVYEYLSHRFNVDVCEASNCQSAIAILAQKFDFECILVDYQLTDGDAISLINYISGAKVAVPVIVFLPTEDEEIGAQMLKMGAVDYLAKDAFPIGLDRSVRHAVQIFRTRLETHKAQQLLRESKERYRLVLESSHYGVWHWHVHTQVIEGNEVVWQMLGLPGINQGLKCSQLYRLSHPQDRPKIRKLLKTNYFQEEKLKLELRLYCSSGSYRYFLIRGKTATDVQGFTVGMTGIISDITGRKRREERSHFLAQANTLLSALIDYRTTLANVAWLAVSRIADWCAIDLLEGDGDVFCQRLAVAHVDSSKEDLVWQLKLAYPQGVNGNYTIPTIWERDCWESLGGLENLITDDYQRKLLKKLRVRSYILVPIAIGQRLFGSMLLACSSSGRNYTAEDVNLAEDLARRAAWALENSKLYREAHEANENLSKAILILGEQQQQLRTLQQLTNLLNQSLTDLPDLLKVMAESVCKAIAGAQLCLITLFNPQCDSLVLKVMAGEGKENLYSDKNLSTQEGWLPQVFLTGESQLIQATPTQLTEDNDYPVVIYAVAIDSVQSGRLGVLAVANWDNSEAFSQDNRALLKAVGEQAAIAIENARLIKTIELREEKLELQNQMLGAKNQELEQQRQEIQLKNLQLMEAAKLKSQFLATMSHELRTPMNAIIGFSQLLLRQRTNSLVPKQEEMVERIFNNGKHLLRLIDDILDLSKIEANRLELIPEKFDLVELIEATVEELHSLAQEKNLALEFYHQQVSYEMISDRPRLRQILVNLISNAIKFTETGWVRIDIWEFEANWLEIQVEDTGIGIATEKLQHIFDEFWQVDQSITRKYGGTGLGLAITESLVVLMQGKISVTSKLGQGSIFRVRLPRYVEV